MSKSGGRSIKRCTTREGISVREAGDLDCGKMLYEVSDHKRQERSLLVIRRVNDALLPGRSVRHVVRFSKREHSPCISDEIRVSTLAHYREEENLESGQRDPMEGRVKLDVVPFVVRSLSKAGIVGADRSSISAMAEYRASQDPWVYCTAFSPRNERDAYRLGKRISSGNDTITKVLDVNAFALELGVDFALALDESIHTKAVSGVSSLLKKARLASSEFQRVFHVNHGPVAYEDISGTLDTGREPVDLASKIGFIKPTSFSYQSEYRFTLETLGEPNISPLSIPVSDALRECTSLM